MAKPTTYIKLDRSILDWRWMTKPNVFTVFVWLILKANIEDHSFETVVIRRGQVATSYERIAEGTGVSKNTIAKILKTLTDSGEIEVKRFSKFQVITILNYDIYQSANTKVNTKIGSEFGTVNTNLAPKTGSEFGTNQRILNKLSKRNKEKEGVGNAAEAAAASVDPRIPKWAVDIGWTDYEKFDAWVNQ